MRDGGRKKRKRGTIFSASCQLVETGSAEKLHAACFSFQLRTFLSDHGSQEVEVEDEETQKENSPPPPPLLVTELESHPEGITGLLTRVLVSW